MPKFVMIGSDPEFFIKTKNTYLPSYLFTEGNKIVPESLGDDYFVLKDNLVIEGNIPPASDCDSWVKNMLSLKTQISNIITEVNDKAILFEGDKAVYKEEYIDTPDGQLFGCSSFIDAWEKVVKLSPNFESNFRTCGFHIHLSYDLTEKELELGYTKPDMNVLIIRALDHFLGLPSDKTFYCQERREGYGLLGSYRDTPYGVEYRPLGGHFTKEKYLIWIYEQVQKTFLYLNDENNLNKLNDLKTASFENYEYLGIDLKKQIFKKK